MKPHPYIRLGQTLARVPFLKDIDQAGLDKILLESVILECDPGAIVGEVALATGDRRNATVTAAERSFVLKVDSDFREKLSEKQQEAYNAELDRFVEAIQAGREA